MVEQSKDKSKVLKECLMSIYPQCNFYIPCEVAPAYDMPNSYYMGLCVSKLMDCDTVIACSGWKGSKGCQCEKFIAETYGIEWSTLKDFCLEVMKDCDVNLSTFDNDTSLSSCYCFITIEQPSHDDNDFKTIHINIDEECSVAYSTIWNELQKNCSKFNGNTNVIIDYSEWELDIDVLSIMYCSLKCLHKNLLINMISGICYQKRKF